MSPHPTEGRWLHREHVCATPHESNRGDVWQCGCGRVYRLGWLGWALIDAPPERAPVFDLVEHVARQRAFSVRAFGPGTRHAGILDHLRREIDGELATVTPGSREAQAEWIDIVILGLDGAWRSGLSPAQIATALLAKQETNEARTWPDWRTVDPDTAIEHDRSVPERCGRLSSDRLSWCILPPGHDGPHDHGDE